MSHDVRLAVAPGTGRMVRRNRALLYLPDGASDQLIADFRHLEDDAVADAICGSVLDDPLAAPEFVFIEWSADAETPRIDVMIRGNVEVVSDVASMPTLSGAGAATWVEHRIIRPSDATNVRCGAPVDALTDLGDGHVSSGGFELELTIVQPPPRPTSIAARPGPPPTPDTDPEAASSPPPRDTRDSQSRLDRIAKLAAAGGGEVVVPSVAPVTGPVPDDRDRSAAPDRRSGQRRHEETLTESVVLAEPDPADDPIATNDVPLIELPDGRRHRVTGTTVLGRRPGDAAARTARAALIEVEAATSVSRTHLRIEPEGLRLVATDCGSSGGTVLVPASGGEAVPLDPWTPVVVADGDRLYLGGNDTKVVIRDA